MSRLYGVSVGYILGMEEEKSTEDTAAQDGPGVGTQADGAHQDPHLSEEQLRMVEEIVKCYTDAR